MSQLQSIKIIRVCETCSKEFFVLPWKLRATPCLYCSLACRNTRAKIPLIERWFSKIGPKDSHGCILWQGGVNAAGYGTIQGEVRRVPVLAHRYAYELAHGSIPPGAFVLHKCDNPPCVAISHLFLGINADNVADMVWKRRHNYGENHF